MDGVSWVRRHPFSSYGKENDTQYILVTDGRIISTVEEVLYRFPQLDDYTVYQARLCEGRSGQYHAGECYPARRKIVFNWHSPYSFRSDAAVRHVVVHEMMHAYHWWLIEGGHIIHSEYNEAVAEAFTVNYLRDRKEGYV